MSVTVWIAIGFAAIVFLIFAAWPLYSTYRTRGQGADVREGQAYLEAKQEWQRARLLTMKRRRPPRPEAVGRPASDEVTHRSGPALARMMGRERSGTGSRDDDPDQRHPPGTHPRAQ